MKAVLYVGRVEGRNTLVKGGIRDWLAESGVPALYSPANRGWWVRTERIVDLVALAEYQGIVVKAGAR